MRIKFHGYLKKLCPKEFYEVAAETAAEGIRGLTNQLKQLRRISGNRWICRVKECPRRDDLYAHNESLTEINVYPDYAPAGGGKVGTMQVIIGAVIVVAAVALAFVTGGASLAAAAEASGMCAYVTTGAAIAAGFSGSVMLTSAAMMGAGLILSGLSAMLTKVPKTTTDDSEANKYFNSGSNTTAIGTRIAIGYGKYKFYGQILSIQQESY